MTVIEKLRALGIDLPMPEDELGALLDRLVAMKWLTLESAFLILDASKEAASNES